MSCATTDNIYRRQFLGGVVIVIFLNVRGFIKKNFYIECHKCLRVIFYTLITFKGRAIT